MSRKSKSTCVTSKAGVTHTRTHMCWAFRVNRWAGCWHRRRAVKGRCRWSGCKQLDTAWATSSHLGCGVGAEGSTSLSRVINRPVSSLRRSSSSSLYPVISGQRGGGHACLRKRSIMESLRKPFLGLEHFFKKKKASIRCISWQVYLGELVIRTLALMDTLQRLLVLQVTDVKWRLNSINMICDIPWNCELHIHSKALEWNYYYYHLIVNKPTNVSVFQAWAKSFRVIRKPHHSHFCDYFHSFRSCSQYQLYVLFKYNYN